MSTHQFYTVAYPSIPNAQAQWIQIFRQKHDPHFTLVEPHFTMVFGVQDIGELVYLKHIDSIAGSSKAIQFVCRYAMLGTDNLNGTAYVFLVPDEGNAEISLLHDSLYRGILKPHHRFELPYIPHITIASAKDFKSIKDLCDEINAVQIRVEGSLNSLSACVLEDGKLRTLRTFPLAA